MLRGATKGRGKRRQSRMRKNASGRGHKKTPKKKKKKKKKKKNADFRSAPLQGPRGWTKPAKGGIDHDPRGSSLSPHCSEDDLRQEKGEREEILPKERMIA